MDTPEPLIVHATAVAVNERAVLIKGASGSGKSSLGLDMMARDAALIADDRVILTPHEGAVLLSCPDPLQGKIEARGVGVLYAEFVDAVELALVVDMDHVETERMPPSRGITYFNQTFPLLHNVASQHFPAAIMQYLRMESTD